LEQSDTVAAAGTTPVPSASAIDSSVFTAGNTIGKVYAIASAIGGYFAGGAAIHDSAIDNSFFTAGAGIGAVTALDHSALGYTNGGHNYYTAAIRYSTFTV